MSTPRISLSGHAGKFRSLFAASKIVLRHGDHALADARHAGEQMMGNGCTSCCATATTPSRMHVMLYPRSTVPAEHSTNCQ